MTNIEKTIVLKPNDVTYLSTIIKQEIDKLDVESRAVSDNMQLKNAKESCKVRLQKIYNALCE